MFDQDACACLPERILLTEIVRQHGDFRMTRGINLFKNDDAYVFGIDTPGVRP